jgi:ABC-type transport system substrate-binding protein
MITAAVRPSHRTCLVLAFAMALCAPARPSPANEAAQNRALKVLPGQKALPLKVLRVASLAETGFDPARVADLYSLGVIEHIFEPLYGYDPLARPVRIVPRTAAALPEVSADFRVWTVRITPGIHFADDAAFGGKSRELTAADYVYSFKRFADPANASPSWGTVEQAGISGLAALRRAALDGKQPFDYAREITGLRALDRYTLRIEVDAARPRLIELLAGGTAGAVAREVVERYADAIMEHPVGTGPFRLAEWRRASRIVLERNPGYREVRYDAAPAADDADGQAALMHLKGKRLPIVDRVEISVIEESQPRWLAFLNGEIDVNPWATEFAAIAMPNGRIAPHLAKRGVRAYHDLRPATIYTYFNMEHPLVGGYTADKVALRRALALAMDVDRRVRLLQSGLAVRAQSPVAVHLSGYDPAFRSEMSEYSPPRAKALLDLYGYVDRDGDGWRDQPDGAPLFLESASSPGRSERQSGEMLERDMSAIGIRVRFHIVQWPELLKSARVGKLMMWTLGSPAGSPDGLAGFVLYRGASAGGLNLARFNLAEMDALYERLLAMPDGAERRAVFDRAKRLAVAYMPYKQLWHPVNVSVVQPWLIGYRRPLFSNNWYEMVDVDRP